MATCDSGLLSLPCIESEPVHRRHRDDPEWASAASPRSWETDPLGRELARGRRSFASPRAGHAHSAGRTGQFRGRQPPPLSLGAPNPSSRSLGPRSLPIPSSPVGSFPCLLREPFPPPTSRTRLIPAPPPTCPAVPGSSLGIAGLLQNPDSRPSCLRTWPSSGSRRTAAQPEARDLSRLAPFRHFPDLWGPCAGASHRGVPAAAASASRWRELVGVERFQAPRRLCKIRDPGGGWR